MVCLGSLTKIPCWLTNMNHLVSPVFSTIHTPSYVLDEAKLLQNLEILKSVQQHTGCKILLAQKAFSMYAVYPMIAKYLSGTTASGLYEAKLGREEFGGEVHIFSPAYREDDFSEIVQNADHIVFNSFAQLKKYQTQCCGKSIGIRVNPECSTQTHGDIYDPCAPFSRLGVTAAQFDSDAFIGVDGIHFHTLCEQNADALAVTLAAVEEKFAPYLKQCKWVNFGGGHHITRADYDVPLLEKLLIDFQNKYDVTVYLEPGEAVALNAGYLVTEVMDIVDNGKKIVLLDASAACHMPDVLEMPYRPPLLGSGEENEKTFSYRLSSCTCLAGDVIGDYSFDEELHIGDRLCFEDMAIYSMVKNNTFNGIALPDIGILRSDGSYQVVKRFGYFDFKERLS